MLLNLLQRHFVAQSNPSSDWDPMSAATAILRGSGSNLVRICCTSIAALALPPLLTRTLSGDEYSAWVTLLQLSTYVGLLDIGLQTVVSRFVAEHHAKSDHERAVRTVVSAVRILLICAALGGIAVAFASAAVTTLLPGMPESLYGPTRLSLLIVGISSAFMLPFGPYLSAFTGLQRYGYPTILAIASRLLSAGAIALGAALGLGIVAMAVALALVNVGTAVAQAIGWHRFVRPAFQVGRVRPDRTTSRVLLTTGGLIALWSLGGLFVNGLDTVIVGHFDFKSAGAFAVAATVVGFLLTLLSGLFSPIMPAAAAKHGPGAAAAICALTVRATRYSSLIIVVLGGGIVVFAYPMLALWVGPGYALDAAPLLRILVLGHCVRQLGYAYSLVVIARGRQKPATIATMSEAAVNLVASLLLAQMLGAVGVAIGTVIGAVVSVALHLVVSMRYAADEIPLTRMELGVRGVLLPLAAGLPLVLVIPTYDGSAMVPADPIALVLAVAGVAAAVLVLGLQRSERQRATARLSGLRNSLRNSKHAY